MTMWTYLLLCCLAAGTVSSSDSSSDSSPASSSTKSNSSLAATPNQLATGFKSFKENFPQPACSVSNAEYTPFSGHPRSLPHSSTIMVQATCSGCNSTVFEQSQVLILVTDAPPFQGKNLMIVLGNEHVFQFIQSGQRYSPSLTFQHNNEIVSVESPQGVTIRDSRRGVTVADLKLFSPTTASVGFVEAQFPQHNITVRYSYNLIWFIRVHLDPTTYRPKQLAGFCGAIVN